MRSLLFTTFLFALALRAMAQDIVCPATSILAANPANREVTLTIGFDGGRPSRYSFLQEAGPLFGTFEAALPRPAELAACDPYDAGCVPGILGSWDEGGVRLAQLVGLVNDYQTNPDLSELVQPHIDISRIASGKAYLIEDASIFGYMGLYEFRDAQDAVLARYFYAVELMRCREP